LQRATGLRQRNEYDRLLAEAVKLGRQHETKAKHFVPKMYDALVKKEGLTPFDAADRIYKDLVGIWQKDTIRRLLPQESKSQVARDMQALSRLTLESNAGSILSRKSDEHQIGQDGSRIVADSEGKSEVIAKLEQENALLVKKLEELENTKKALLERTLKLERLLDEEKQQRHRSQQVNDGASIAEKDTATIVLPPHLFMKTFTLMRGSTKPLVLKVMAREAIDVDRVKL
jgi:hypothetical protein